MALKLRTCEGLDESLAKNIQLMNQCLDTYTESGEATDCYTKEQVYSELEGMANGEVYWKKLYLKDRLWNSPFEIEILANPVHMAIILGDENLALQIYERLNIPYDEDKMIELVRFSSMKGKVLKPFTIEDVFAGFASGHEIWRNLSKSFRWSETYSDDVIFNNLFWQYKSHLEFSSSEDMEEFFIEKLRMMKCGIPGYFRQNRLLIKRKSGLIYDYDYAILLRKACIFLQAFREDEVAVEQYVQSYMKCISKVCLAEDIHYNREIYLLMKKLEKLCGTNERLNSQFSELILLLATKQAVNFYYSDMMTPIYILDSENASKEGVLSLEYFIDWAKSRKPDYNVGDYYDMVRNLELGEVWARDNIELYKLYLMDDGGKEDGINTEI